MVSRGMTTVIGSSSKSEVACSFAMNITIHLSDTNCNHNGVTSNVVAFPTAMVDTQPMAKERPPAALSIRLPAVLHEKISKLAADDHRTLSSWIVHALSEAAGLRK